MSDQSPMDPGAPTRRDFVSSLAVGSFAAAAMVPRRSSPPASEGPSRASTQPPPVQLPPPKDDGPWDMSWLDRVDRAKYKLMFDIGAYLNGTGLYYAKNYLNGMRDGWGVEAPKVLPLLGVSGDAYPLVFGDAVWEKYHYGVSSKTNDSRTGQPAIRNVWWQPRAGESMAEFGVDVLQARGCQMLLCNNVFRGVIRRAMQETSRPYAEVRAELKAGLLPGVIVVPAMVAAMAMSQAHGAAYVFAGA